MTQRGTLAAAPGRVALATHLLFLALGLPQPGGGDTILVLTFDSTSTSEPRFTAGFFSRRLFGLQRFPLQDRQGARHSATTVRGSNATMRSPFTDGRGNVGSAPQVGGGQGLGISAQLEPGHLASACIARWNR
jgi:hypothetical protein